MPSLARCTRAAESDSRGPAAAAGPGSPSRAYCFRAACVACGGAARCEGCCWQAPRLAYCSSGERGAGLLPPAACAGALGAAGLGVAWAGGAGAGSLCCGCRTGAAAKLGGGARTAPRRLPRRGRWARSWAGAPARVLAAKDGAAGGALSARFGGCWGALLDRGCAEPGGRQGRTEFQFQVPGQASAAVKASSCPHLRAACEGRLPPGAGPGTCAPCRGAGSP